MIEGVDLPAWRALRARGEYSNRYRVAATIFLGAFFLFQVEPLIAKMILPWFGGSAEVWTACLLFFQGALLCGYLYAHLLAERFTRVWQVRIHSGLLIASLVWLPMLPSARWKPLGGEDPLPLIIGLLAATVGLPFLLLSSTSSLLQAWRSQDADGFNDGQKNSTYRLYALSNLGSMLALLSYPVLVEPMLPTRMQGWLWSVGYLLFVLVSLMTAWGYRNTRRPKADLARIVSGTVAPTLTERLAWFSLSTTTSALLLAVTNHMLQNIAAIPLLWVVPLSLYLLSFILCFDSQRWYRRRIWYGLFFLAVGMMMYGAGEDFPIGNLRVLLTLYAMGLFICFMVCHGELAAMRPSPRHLTSYYLTIASGGAFGGLLVAALAPAIFNASYDLTIILPATALVAILVAWRNALLSRHQMLRWAALGSMLFLWSLGTGHMVKAQIEGLSNHIRLARNFYGSLKVMDWGAIDPLLETRELVHGTINHGEEFTAPSERRKPLSYFSERSGVGKALIALGKDGPLKVGIIGLGAGALAAYCREGDVFRFYEINPMVQTIAVQDFWYLSLCPAKWNITLGDGRLSLERSEPEKFDLLAVDAFTSDAIPVHLLTKEAFALYWRHLKPDGVLAVQVTNRYVNLAPIVALAAAESGKTARLLSNAPDKKAGISSTDWVLISSRPGFFSSPVLGPGKDIRIPKRTRGWTDDYSDLWEVLY